MEVDTSAELRKRRNRISSKSINKQSTNKEEPDGTASTTTSESVDSTTSCDRVGDDDDVVTVPSITNSSHQRPETQTVADDDDATSSTQSFRLHVHFDPMTVLLLAVAIATRIYRLAEPNHIVFDELHYGKYVSLYMKRTFFFDQHPPLGKQLIAGIAHLAGYSGNFTFSRIGGEYSSVCLI